MNVQVKGRMFYGVICEQQVYTISDKVSGKNIAKADKYLRFKTDEERLRHKEDMSRRRLIRLMNATCDPSFYYVTLTFDDPHEVHTFKEARHIRDLYYRRLMYAFPHAAIFLFMGRGENTNRIHLHMVCGGIPEEAIIDKWTYGSIVSCEHLREHNYYDGRDYGRDYTGLAIYLFKHWTPEQGGHRWKASRNVRQPEVEKPKIMKRKITEDNPPIAPPGYVLVEIHKTPYGYINFKYVRGVTFDESATGQLSLKGWRRTQRVPFEH